MNEWINVIIITINIIIMKVSKEYHYYIIVLWMELLLLINNQLLSYIQVELSWDEPVAVKILCNISENS